MRTKVIEKNAYPFLEKRTLATTRCLEKLVDDIARALLTFHLVYFSRRSVLLFFCVFALRFHAIQRRFRVGICAEERFQKDFQVLLRR